MTNTITLTVPLSQVAINGVTIHGDADCSAGFVTERGLGEDGFGADRVCLGSVLDNDYSVPPRRVCIIGLNPSKATHLVPDPTFRRCRSFAVSWGYNVLTLVNLFSYRSTDPRGLIEVTDPQGDPWNMNAILRAVGGAEIVVAAWGHQSSPKALRILVTDRAAEVERRVREVAPDKLHYLQLTKGGVPGHPLYLKSDLKPKRWVR